MVRTRKAEPRVARRPGQVDVARPGAGTVELLHATVYANLRQRFITGRVAPGATLSTRSVAEELGVSQTPVREALSRLAAEGAVEIRSKRRIVVPLMTPDRFDDLLRCRVLLEPEAALQAFPLLDRAMLKRLRAIDGEIDAALASGDVAAYIEGNCNFHFLIYRSQPRRTLTQLIETLWLQIGPYMRVVYGRFGTAQLVDQHQRAIAAIEARDPTGFAQAIASDISDGMGLIGRSGFRSAAH